MDNIKEWLNEDGDRIYLMKGIIYAVQMLLTNSFVIRLYFSRLPLYKLLTACFIFDGEHHLFK